MPHSYAPAQMFLVRVNHFIVQKMTGELTQ
jgi:hypothetical protein